MEGRKYVCVHVWAHGCMHLCIDGWMGGWIDGWKEGSVHVLCADRMDGRVGGWVVDGWTCMQHVQMCYKL
jgi:hypothetical protein